MSYRKDSDAKSDTKTHTSTDEVERCVKDQ